jgi:biotin/methionine sulfoxide reductase
MDPKKSRKVMHSSHWGAFSVEAENGQLRRVQPFAGDPDPSPLLRNFEGEGNTRARVLQPSIRRGWLEGRGQGVTHRELRGNDSYVEVTWDEALSVLARELKRVRDMHGPQAVFGGSYGWASAGRFHHAQSQVHRFLNLAGGYTGSVNTYSQGASSVVLPHVLGVTVADLLQQSTTWKSIEQHTKLFVAFGGVPLKNAAVCAGGTGQHMVSGQLRAAQAAGTRFVLVSPQRSDLPEWLDVDWLPIEPGTDTALMLAFAHVLDALGLADRDFLRQYCVGAEDWLAYVRGAADGIAKTPDWAGPITGIAPERITALAREMAADRTFLTTSWSVQRSWYGEQPVWASIALAALLGQIGLPGGGVGHGYGMTSSTGQSFVAKMPTLDQGKNAVDSFIPVARIADMLLDPGGRFGYNGRTLRYPDIRLVYWCGGNPFHHHQDLHRLRRAFSRPETIVVHEPYWTATARHADIVLPATTTLERNDIGCSGNARHVFAMQQALLPVGDARSDYDIFTALAQRMGFSHEFTEGRDEMAWLSQLYESWRGGRPAPHGPVPPFAQFWKQGVVELSANDGPDQVFLANFRHDPIGNPLRTPSGRIEITSDRVRDFGYDDCPGYPVWREPPEWHGSKLAQDYPLILIANNPATRLHSQLDAGPFSAASKVAGREPMRIHPNDAAHRGIAGGDIVRVFNARGSLLAGAVISDTLKPRVVQLSTGAWLDLHALEVVPGGSSAPKQSETCLHGNPNVLTADCGTSSLSQGCVGQISLVQVELFRGAAPAQRAWELPAVLRNPSEPPREE